MAKQIKNYTAFDAGTPADNDDLYVIQKESTNETMKVKASNAIPDGVITGDKIDWASGDIWWEELGRDTLTTTGDSMTVTIPVRKFLNIIVYAINSGTISTQITFNGDTGTNYARRRSDNGGADTSNTSEYNVSVSTAVAGIIYSESYVINIATQEKLVISSTSNIVSGAGTAPTRRENAGKWVNTTDAITSVTCTNNQSGSYLADSYLIVLGHD